MRKFFNILLGFLMVLGFLGGMMLPDTASALMMFTQGTSLNPRVSHGHNLDPYTRGIQRSTPNTPNRFMYANPYYRNNRQVKPRPQCKNHGLSRCLQPKEPSPFVYNRPPYQTTPEKVHPYVRKIYQIKNKRYN